MEKKTKSVIKKTLFGGLLVLLPIGIMLYIARWMFDITQSFLQPVTNLVIKNNGLPEIIGDLVAMGLLCLLCFLVGLAVTTGAGRWFHSRFDSALAKVAPGYRIVKEIVNQFFGDDESPFNDGEVALLQLYGKDCPILATVLITSRSEEYASCTLLTCPNITSGITYHAPWELIQRRPDVNVDSALRTIVAMGAGSTHLFGWTPLDQSIDSSIKPVLEEGMN